MREVQPGILRSAFNHAVVGVKTMRHDRIYPFGIKLVLLKISQMMAGLSRGSWDLLAHVLFQIL